MNINRDFKVTQSDGKVILPDGTQLNMTAPDYMYLQMLQNYVLEILEVIDEFCKKHNLKYYLGEGTLLGAVRHEGFIPWDDDIDLFMPREDYEKFFELAKTGLPEGYVVDTPETNPKHWTIFSHVQMTRTVPYVKQRLQGIALNAGPTVDIMPIDYVPDDSSRELIKRGDLIQLLRRTLWIKSGLHQSSWYKTLKRKLTIYYPLKFYGKFRSYASLHKQINGLMTATNNDDSKYATVFSSLYSTKKETFKREYFGKPTYVPFAGGKYPIPEFSDKILERVYGDYNALPRIKDRQSKHFFAIDNKLLSNVKEPEVIALVEEIQALQLSENIRMAKYKAKKKYVITPENLDSKPVNPFKYMEKHPVTYKAKAIAPKRKRGVRALLVYKIQKFCKKLKKKILKKFNRFAKRIQSNAIRTATNRYVKLPIKDNYVFFDAFSGLGILDSPRALFKNLISRDEFKNYKFVWTINNPKIAKENLNEFAKYPNVVFVRRYTKKYAKYLSISKYLVSNSSVPMYYGKRPEQIYINTWHGVPLKVMGYERIGQRVNATENIVRNFLNATHVIGANHFTAEKMFKTAYMFDGLYGGKLLDEPLPRTDTTKTFTREQSLEKLAKFGIKTDKKIVVYAPTWKGKLYNSVNIDLTELKDAVRILKNRINSDEYEVYLRVHYFIYRAISMDKELSKICIPFTVDTNELLPAVDILISDYSSIFFDFLSTGKPILFYVPDLADYSENRGLYISLDELPGPVSENLEDIADYINNIEQVKKDYADNYSKMFDWCCSKEDGKVCDRVIDDIFFGKPCKTVSCTTYKKKILIMADFTTNFTNKSRLIKYFDTIDYDKYDITLLSGKPIDAHQKQVLEDINKNVRILINDMAPNVNHRKLKKIYSRLQKSKITITKASNIINMQHEWHRLVGISEFDKLIFVQPNNMPENWLLLAHNTPIDEKVFVSHKTIDKNIFERESFIALFDKVYTDFTEL